MKRQTEGNGIRGIPGGRAPFFRMTPDANDLCVFAIKRGYIVLKRIDVQGTYQRIISQSNFQLNHLLL